jgi:hypothetical protein
VSSRPCCALAAVRPSESRRTTRCNGLAMKSSGVDNPTGASH